MAMNQNNITATSAPQEKNQQPKQLKMKVEGCVVKLNFAQTADGKPMETVKKMILSGLSKV